jgi:4-hydroxy-2-oxoheptanedioate aldolase
MVEALTTKQSHPLVADDARPGDRLRSGVTLGLFLVTASPLMAEACSTRDVDFLVIDMEASYADRNVLTQCLQGITGSGVISFARLANSDKSNIEAALDCGVDGIIVPKVSTQEQAEAIADASQYPPLGRRGLNPIRCSGYFADISNYLKTANSRTVRGVQIETKEGVDNVEKIAGVEGIDLLFVGCGDLAAALGHIGNVDHPDVRAAIDRILKACRAKGKIPGIFAYSEALAKQYRDAGYRFIAIGNELKFMLSAIEESVAHLR